MAKERKSARVAQHRRSLAGMKQFRLISYIMGFIVLVTAFVSVYFYQYRAREVQESRTRRLNNLASVYEDQYNDVSLLVHNLSVNELVYELQYEQGASASISGRTEELINALSLLRAAYSAQVQPFVYFYNSDAVVSTSGKTASSLFLQYFSLEDRLDFAALHQNRSREIWIFPNVPVYFNVTYADRHPIDYGTLYVYTQNDASVLLLFRNAPLLFLMETAIQSGDAAFVVWDTASGQPVLSNTGETAAFADWETCLASFSQAHAGWAIESVDSGRFCFAVAESGAEDGLLSMQINLFLLGTVAIGVAFTLLYYFILRKEVFQPLAEILQKLQVGSRPRDEYGAIENAIGHLQSRIQVLSENLREQEAQKQEAQMRRALLGVQEARGPDGFAKGKHYALIALMGESEDAARAVCGHLARDCCARLIAHIGEQRIFLVWLRETAEYEALVAAVQSLPLEDSQKARLALGLSRAYDSPTQMRDAYLESCGVLHARPVKWGAESTPGIVYIAGRGELDKSVSVPLDAKDSSVLLSLITRGETEAAVQFVADVLDPDLGMTIEQNRYRAIYLLNVLGMAQNTRRDMVFDLTVLTSQVHTLVRAESMRALVLQACEQLTQAFAGAESDSLIRFILGYVEKHYMENIYLKTIAEEAGLSYAYVSHYFSERQGVGFADYLNSVRIQKACEMLAHTRLSLQEIAMRVGFGSMNTFMRNMKKFTGTTPDAYRKLHSEA